MSNSSVVCWEPPTHICLVSFAIIGVRVHPVAILAVIAHIALRYPALIASKFGLKLLTPIVDEVTLDALATKVVGYYIFVQGYTTGFEQLIIDFSSIPCDCMTHLCVALFH